jgi:hypothetical protein
MEEQRLRAFENGVLRKIFGLPRDGSNNGLRCPSYKHE